MNNGLLIIVPDPQWPETIRPGRTTWLSSIRRAQRHFVQTYIKTHRLIDAGEYLNPSRWKIPSDQSVYFASKPFECVSLETHLLIQVPFNVTLPMLRYVSEQTLVLKKKMDYSELLKFILDELLKSPSICHQPFACIESRAKVIRVSMISLVQSLENMAADTVGTHLSYGLDSNFIHAQYTRAWKNSFKQKNLWTLGTEAMERPNSLRLPA